MTGRLPDVAMRGITVRFDEAQKRFIAAQAERAGVSAAQFIRDAAFGRAILQWGANASTQEAEAVLRLLAGEPSSEEVELLLKRIAPAMYAADDGD